MARRGGGVIPGSSSLWSLQSSRVVFALVLPGIQALRESARQKQCQNNLKQFALGCLNHEQFDGWLPTDGWGGAWTGDADLGIDRKQPGGWIYNTAPFVESQSWHDLGMGLPVRQKDAANLQRLSLPWPAGIWLCPARRLAIARPWTNSWPVVNAGLPKLVDRTDYAANGGDAYTSPARRCRRCGIARRRATSLGRPAWPRAASMVQPNKRPTPRPPSTTSAKRPTA